MVVAPKAGEAPVQSIDAWANLMQKRASLLCLDSPLFGATTQRQQSCYVSPYFGGV